MALLERVAPGRFRIVGEADASVRAALAEPEPGVVAPMDDGTFLAAFLADAERAWATGETLASAAFTEPGADGTSRTLEATALTIDGRPHLLLGPPRLSHGVTQRLLQGVRDETLALDRARRRADARQILLHCIVHDLSNPLAAIRGALGLLLDEPSLEGEAREIAEIAGRQAETLRGLIRSVLDVFASEADALRATTTPTDPPADAAATVRGVARAFAPRAEAAGLVLRATAPDAPMPVVGDEARLERALFNLADNALRHARSAVAVEARAEGETVVIAVEDDGPGVDPDAVDGLFTLFEQRGGRPVQAGLGLYACRITAEAWGGSVAYAPRPEGGARFTLTLPRVGG